MLEQVLVVEDESDIANIIKLNLEDIGLTVTTCGDGQQGLELASKGQFHIILLDVMLPSLDGLEVCRRLRNSNPQQVIIMLTSRISETDRVVGLELGADDYLTKPFSVRELQARVKSQLRRIKIQDATSQPSGQKALSFGDLLIDPASHQVKRANELIKLTATEFELLNFLTNRPNQVFSRDQLLEQVWGYTHSGYEHTVNSTINRLRAKLEANPNKPEYVQTVWGVGYKFNPGMA